MKGGEVTPNAGNTFTDVAGITDTITVRSSDAYGIGGGIIWQYDFGNKSYFRLFSLWGYGLTNFSAENLGNSIGAFQTDVNNFRLGRPASNVQQTGPRHLQGQRQSVSGFDPVPVWLRICLECEPLLFVRLVG